MAAQTSSLERLAADIEAHTKSITDALRARKLAEPTFLSGSPQEIWESSNPVISTARMALLEAASQLSGLMAGPHAFYRECFGSQYDLAALQIALECKVFDFIPSQGLIGLEQLAGEVKMEPNVLGRLLRLLGTQHVFEEPQEGQFGQTARSKVIVDDVELRAQVEMQLDEMHKASVESADYFRKQLFNDGGTDSIFKFKWNDNLYNFYAKDEVKAGRFALAQEGIAKLDRPITSVVKWIEQSKILNGRLVDVGGGSGYVALQLAQAFPCWIFKVQDISSTMFSHTLQAAEPRLFERIVFETHDFFNPQPLDTDTDVYLLRSCLHNWDDGNCIRILKTFVPALRANPKAALLVNELIIPKRGSIPLREERFVRQNDIAMMILLNSKQRSEEDWRNLVQQADNNLTVSSIVTAGTAMGVLELRYIA